jgi:hypothetical protein
LKYSFKSEGIRQRDTTEKRHDEVKNSHCGVKVNQREVEKMSSFYFPF